ncbi:aldo/keto reductase family oxidoreductase [Acidocella sp.]|uniref:aldo/keto reductase n=1 Tax=Acidocella sp. TaxID=50710 RepID=UPI00261F8707|nr:aldo/keto reductase [Acidocella sp.]
MSDEGADHLPAPPLRRALGGSGIMVSPLAWGMWRLTAGNNTLAEVSRLVEGVLDAGITLFDTADIYGFTGMAGFGAAEALLGEVLAAAPGLRARMVLSTKAGIRPPFPYDQSPAYLARALEASLRRLRVETIDLFHIHRPDLLTHPQEVAKTLDAAVAAGKIRALGVSNFTPHQLAALQHFLGTRLAVTQPEISPLRIACFDNGELDQAMMLGLTPLAWSPLGGGRLLAPQTGREREIAGALDLVAREAGVSRATAAYGWLMAHPAGIIPIIGSQQPARIAEALAARPMRWTRRGWYEVFAAARGEKLP